MKDVQKSSKFTGARCNKNEIIWNWGTKVRHKAKKEEGEQWQYFDLIDETVGSAASLASVTEVCAAKADRPVIAPEAADDDDTRGSNKSLTESNKPNTSIRKWKWDQPPRWFAEFTKSWEEEGKKTDALPEVRQHPATSELRSVFAGAPWNVCSLRVDCSCVQIKHACPTLCWKLWSFLNATVQFWSINLAYVAQYRTLTNCEAWVLVNILAKGRMKNWRRCCSTKNRQ